MEYSNVSSDQHEPNGSTGAQGAQDQGLTSYQILGVSDTDSLATIQNTYRQFMRLLHPDRANTEEAIRLGFSASEKYTMFLKIKNAYQSILEERKEVDSPDYNIEYTETSDTKLPETGLTDLTIVNKIRYHLHAELLGSVRKDIDAGQRKVPVVDPKVRNIQFNQLFEQQKESKESTEPFSRGYEKDYMSKERTEEHNNIMRTGKREDIQVPQVPVGPPADRVPTWPWPLDSIPRDIIVPNRGLFEGHYPMDHCELGIVNITDFSTDKEYKGTDLHVAENISITEFKTVSTTSKITNEELEKLMNDYRSVNIDIAVVDLKTEKEIGEYRLSSMLFESQRMRTDDEFNRTLPAIEAIGLASP